MVYAAESVKRAKPLIIHPNLMFVNIFVQVNILQFLIGKQTKRIYSDFYNGLFSYFVFSSTLKKDQLHDCLPKGNHEAGKKNGDPGGIRTHGT